MWRIENTKISLIFFPLNYIVQSYETTNWSEWNDLQDTPRNPQPPEKENKLLSILQVQMVIELTFSGVAKKGTCNYQKFIAHTTVPPRIRFVV